MTHDLTLVTDDVDMYIVGQRSLIVTDNILHMRAKLDDVLAANHLQRQQDTLLTVISDILTRIGVLTFDGSDVAQADHIIGETGTDDGLCQLILGVERGLDMDGPAQLAVIQTTCIEGAVQS